MSRTCEKLSEDELANRRDELLFRQGLGGVFTQEPAHRLWGKHKGVRTRSAGRDGPLTPEAPTPCGRIESLCQGSFCLVVGLVKVSSIMYDSIFLDTDA